MPSGAAVACLLQGTVTPTKALWVGGLSLLKKAGATSPAYGVPLESIEVIEARWDAVSSMRFLVDDPAKELTFTEGAEVLFQDLTRDVPIFRGFIDTIEADMSEAGIWPQWEITAVGVEILLDWMKVPSLTIGTADCNHSAELEQMILAQATGVGVPLRAFHAGSNNSTQAAPMCTFAGWGQLNDATDVSGMSVRQAIQTAIANVTFGALNLAVTVDYYYGLRVMQLDTTNGTVQGVTDWAGIAVVESGGTIAANLEYKRSFGGVFHQVYVKGGNAAGSGLVTDGSGIKGDVGLISDTTSTTATRKAGIGGAFLGAHQVAIAGSLDVEDQLNVGTPGAEVRAGEVLQITSTPLGLNGTVGNGWVGSVSFTKRFYGASETWSITFGAQESAAQSLRRLTRNTLT